jgi:hypothetical protein
MTGNSRHDRKGWPGNAKAWLDNAKNRAFRSPIEKPVEKPLEKPLENAGERVNDRLIEATVISDPRQFGAMTDGAAYAYEPDATVYRTTGYAGLDGHEYPYEDDDDGDPVLDALALGLAGPRQRVSDLQWINRVRRFGRATVWCLPAAVVALAVTTVWGWPRPGDEPHGASPGTWLLVTILGLALWTVGLVAVAALAVSTPGRPWALASLLLGLVGAPMVAAMAGVVGIARPAVSRSTDPALAIDAQLLDGSVGRALAVGGLLLLALSGVALALTVLASEVLNRFDGWLVLGGVGVAVVGAYLSWPFLLTLACMALLAAALGVAWNASRLTADGHLRDV